MNTDGSNRDGSWNFEEIVGHQKVEKTKFELKLKWVGKDKKVIPWPDSYALLEDCVSLGTTAWVDDYFVEHVKKDDKEGWWNKFTNLPVYTLAIRKSEENKVTSLKLAKSLLLNVEKAKVKADKFYYLGTVHRRVVLEAGGPELTCLSFPYNPADNDGDGEVSDDDEDDSDDGDDNDKPQAKKQKADPKNAK